MKDIIAARRKYIKDSAQCESCGDTLANCKAEQGKDPTAPPWFGCCAQGLDMRPCRHIPSRAALSELLDEIESGHVRTVEQVIEEARPKRRSGGMTWLDYLDQGEKWKPDGKPMVAIASMDAEWRYNASRFLERRAANIAPKYSLSEHIRLSAMLSSPLGPSENAADALERDFDEAESARVANPVGWIRTTALYRALVADLPKSLAELDEIADRARHWADCLVRTGGGPSECCCEQLRAQVKGAAA